MPVHCSALSPRLIGALTCCDCFELVPPIFKVITAATLAVVSPCLAISANAVYLAVSALAFACAIFCCVSAYSL